MNKDIIRNIKKPLIIGKAKALSFVAWFKGTSKKKKAAVIIAILIVLFFATAPLRAKKIQYTTDTVRRESITDVVSESGNVANSGVADVSSTSTGIIQQLYVGNGDSVTAGQNLFQVKSTASPNDKATALSNYQSAVSSEKTAEQNKIAAQSSLEQARAAILSAQDSVNNVVNNYNNPSTGRPYVQIEKDAVNSNYTSDQETFTQNEKKYLESDTAIAAAKTLVTQTWIAYQATQDSVVIAPASGIVQNLAYGIGDKVFAPASSLVSTTTTNASSVLYIVSQQDAMIKIQLNEVDIPKVKVGQHAKITLPAIRNKTFSGTVRKVDDIGTNTLGVITYNVYVSIDSTDPIIKSLMSANVDIETAHMDNALTVANEAIKPYKGGKAVQILSGNTLKFIPVTVGIKGIDRTEILKGVTEGTFVVTGIVQPSAAPGGGS